jgi:hypothetical protein
MSQINPFIGSILQSTTVQRAQAAEKNGHVQRAQNRAKDSASTGDQFEHQVESSDAVVGIHDEDPQHPQQRKPKHPPKNPSDSATDGEEGEGPAHIDVKV